MKTVFIVIAGTLCSFLTSLQAQTAPFDVAGMLANGQASVASSTTDVGSVGSIFDGNTTSLARSQSINPMVVTLSFTTPKQFAKSRVWFLAGNNRWRIETADSVADLDAGTGTFRVALDWATGSEASWQERVLGTQVPCRAIRLKLQRLTGDNYVHLNEWQLFLVDLPFMITKVERTGPGLELSWNSVANQWYEIQSSAGLKTWGQVGFQKGSEGATTFPLASPPAEDSFFRVRNALPEERPTITKRVLVLNLNPIIEANGNQRLNQVLGWNDPHTLTPAYLGDLGSASGDYVRWEVAATVDLDLWPAATDGFRYTDTTYLQSWNNPQQYPWHMPNGADYGTLLDLPLETLGNKTAHQMAASGEVDEIVVWGAPYMSIQYESRMVGSTAYFCNAPALVRNSRLYVVMGLNYERGVAEAVHSFGHRSESILSHVYGSWSGSATINHLWDRFTRAAPRHGVSVAGCGNVHFPPNAANDYEYYEFS